jgi:DNA-binding PadR family transcriptional regulator
VTLSAGLDPDASSSVEKAGWMRGSSAALRGALLGLLLEHPGHGADLAHRLAARLGETWRVDVNDVYRLLEQLERVGLAVSRSEPRRVRRCHGHLVYYPTPLTSGALSLWMESLGPREPVRLGLQAKLAVARPQDAPCLLVALKAHERECLGLAKRLSPGHAPARSWRALCLESSREAVLGQLCAEIEWVVRTRRRIAEWRELVASPRRPVHDVIVEGKGHPFCGLV